MMTGDVVRTYMSEYSKYVAQNRAIPNLIDGLKPSQRRCITAADDLHLYHNGRYLKAAKIEGQVIGDYHPHGGVSLAGLIQPFRSRYPLMEGQGNWGCPDNPNSVAASRYVEARLSEFCEKFYLESRKYATFAPNYDGRLSEVVQYYPPVPGVLITSASGIAIGLTTNIPPYEIGSICDSMLKYYVDPDSDDYLDLIPDTCEGSVLLSSKEEVDRLHKTGSGTLRYRAKVHHENSPDGELCLVVDSFPPNFSRKKLESPYILSKVESGELTLHNESSTGIRYVFKSKSLDVLNTVESILESSVSYKFVAENQGVVHQYSLREIYDEFKVARIEYIVREYTQKRDSAKKELDYNRALLRLKQSPNRIRNLLNLSEDEAITDLMEYLGVQKEVVTRILSSSIRSLLKDNLEKIQESIDKYEEIIRVCTSHISDPERKLLDDLRTAKETFGGRPNCIREDDSTSPMVYTVDEDGKIIVSTVSQTPEDNRALLDSKYFILYNETSYVGCTKDILEARLPDSILREPPIGILGCKDLSEITVREKKRDVKLGDWVLRSRKSSHPLNDATLIRSK